MSEPCQHPELYGQLCTRCGEEVSVDELQNHQPIVGGGISNVGLSVRRENAQQYGQENANKLLEARKLILILDLDKTLIHSTIDSIASHWLREGVYDIFHFDLGKHTYYTKVRPGLHAFLEDLYPYYEMHIYTMGRRNYAERILRIIDPSNRFFSTRILTQDESFSIENKAKNLDALLPGGDSMAVILDDLPAVWDFQTNVVPALPYEFFKHVEEVNAIPQQRSQSDRRMARKHEALQRMHASNAIRITDRLIEPLYRAFRQHASTMTEENPEHQAHQATTDAESWSNAVALALVTHLRTAIDWDGLEAISSAVDSFCKTLTLNEDQRKEVQQWARDQEEQVREALRASQTHSNATQHGRDLQRRARLAEDVVRNEVLAAAEAVATAFRDLECTFEVVPLPPYAAHYCCCGTETIIIKARKRHVGNAGPVLAERFAAARRFILGQATCLRDLTVNQVEIEADFGSWLCQLVRNEKEKGVDEAIRSRLRCFEPLDAALLVMVAKRFCPCDAWAPDVDTSAILSVILDTLRSAPERRLRLAAPPDRDPTLRVVGTALKTLHTSFFDQYDRGIKPNTRDLLPNIASLTETYPPWALAGCILLFTGIIPKGQDVATHRAWRQAVAMGARVVDEVKFASILMSRRVTHVIARKAGTEKLNQALDYPGVFLVSLRWLEDTFHQGARAKESKYPLEGLPSCVPSRSKPAHKTASQTAPPSNRTASEGPEPEKKRSKWAALADELDDELGDLTSEDEEDEDQSEAKVVYSESEDDRARKQPVPRAALPDDFHTWRKPKRTVQRESEGSESRDSAPQPAQRRQTATLDELEEKGYTMKNDSDADEDAEESFDEVSASEDEGGMDLTGE
ncbi:uncharacterized protein MONBRDRAFT_24379 [Monosiga brevicollis MX1]|uniref:RNA polymerase II subunit A C-terminal domain phosphatase n=1 Tax=Monosiga brevicollis TaxID=81824 RepID=A9UW87_MONBE|nr:uncharacterized protein MONBRDRAFT_24379 [Monosiga brevicollis MX1]EDQ90522.1 predicted protein [Monosiga brevicollis MX1]|eukprot:XP_001744573.1 hypothetical protein [Monosiga brevicollis MX1]